MALARRDRFYDEFKKSSARSTDEFVEWRFPERAALAICRDMLARVRVALSERVRTGSQQGLMHLKAERTKLSAEIQELEGLLKSGN